MKTQPILYISLERIISNALIVSFVITIVYFFILLTKYLLKYAEYQLKISSSYPKDQIVTQQMIEAEMYRQYPEMFNTYKKIYVNALYVFLGSMVLLTIVPFIELIFFK